MIIFKKYQIVFNWRICLPVIWEYPDDWKNLGMTTPIFKSLDLGILEIRLFSKWIIDLCDKKRGGQR